MGADKASDRYRSLVSGLDCMVQTKWGRRPIINLDNAATTPPLKAVLTEIERLTPWYASVNRGSGLKAAMVSDIYEQGREAIKKFVGAGDDSLVVYTKNTTESLNLLAELLYQLMPDKMVLISGMEHLSNYLPWLKFPHRIIEVDGDGRLRLDHLAALLERCSGKVGLVCLAGASNVTGYLNPLAETAAMVHRSGGRLLVDGAQLVPHYPICMDRENTEEKIDFLAFSAHKLYAPFGCGVLVLPSKLGAVQPLLKGGGSVNIVSRGFINWAELPQRLEAGTANFFGVAALLKAVECCSQLGMKALYEHEYRLNCRLQDKLSRLDGVKLYGTAQAAKVGITAFAVKDMPHRVLAQALAQDFALEVRTGMLCAHTYVQQLLGISPRQAALLAAAPAQDFPGLVRLSCGMYNTAAEIDYAAQAIEFVLANCQMYKQRYGAGSQQRKLPR